jgi:lysyl-tRNA synthetase class II
VQKKDFYRVGNLPKPVYKNGLVTNCDVSGGASTGGASSGSGALFTIKEAARTNRPEKNVTSRQSIEVLGRIEQDNNAAGGSYSVNGGKGRQYTLGFVRDLDEDTQNKLNRLVKSGVSVTVKGVLKTWADGSTSFDTDQPVTVNFVTIKSTTQYSGKTTGSKQSIEVTGRVDFGTNAAGSNFFINSGRGKQYILGYYRDLDEDTQNQLARLADSGTVITAKGVMRSWDDGTTSFDSSQVINLYFVVKKDAESSQNGSYGNPQGRATVAKSVTVSGKVEYGSNAAGGTYWINNGKGKQFTLGYVRDLDQDTQNQLSRLSESGDKVTVKGTLKSWQDGTASFDNSQAISIYKMK